jgi:hypothetical protein
MNNFQREYLNEYFNSLTDAQRTELIIKFFEELQIQEWVDCPTKQDLEEDSGLVPYWAHSGDPLI